MDTRKRVIIDADASSVQQEMERVSQQGSQLYSRLKKEAEEYSEDLNKQAVYIEKALNLEKRRLEQQIQYSRTALDMKKEKDMEGAENRYEKTRIEEDYEKERKFIDTDYMSVRQEITQAQMQHGFDYDDERRAHMRNETDREVGEGDAMNMARQSGNRFIMMGRRMGSTVFRSAMAGMGLGMGLGIGSIIYMMVDEANKLEKSQKSLSAVMGDLDRTSLSSAASIGKTVAEMNEFTKQVAVASGGSMGRQTADRSMFLAQFSKGFGVDENTLLQTLDVQRMGGQDTSAELVSLMRELLKVGTISKDNMALLPEKVEYWSRLNNMQSEQLINVIPGLSRDILGTMEGTELPILSDQRQMEFIEGINNAIKNPQNEYTRAFVFDALNNGNLIDTMIQMEKGVFGEGNVTKIMSSMMQNFGQNEDQATMAFSKIFGTSMNTSRMLITELFAPENAEKLQAFMNGFERLAKTTTEYEEAIRTGDKDKQKEIEDRLVAERTLLKNEYGIDPGETAAEKTARSEQIIANLKTMMGNYGGDTLDELMKLMQNGDVNQMIETTIKAVGLGSAQLIKVAADLIIEGAKLFNETAGFLHTLFGDDRDYEKDLYGKPVSERYKSSNMDKFLDNLDLMMGGNFPFVGDEQRMIDNLKRQYTNLPDSDQYGVMKKQIKEVIDYYTYETTGRVKDEALRGSGEEDLQKFINSFYENFEKRVLVEEAEKISNDIRKGVSEERAIENVKNNRPKLVDDLLEKRRDVEYRLETSKLIGEGYTKENAEKLAKENINKQIENIKKMIKEGDIDFDLSTPLDMNKINKNKKNTNTENATSYINEDIKNNRLIDGVVEQIDRLALAINLNTDEQKAVRLDRFVRHPYTGGNAIG